MTKRPSFQFYPGDWLRDAVSGCSLAAQGLWLRLLIVAHDAERYGYLSINGLPIPEDSLARKCGCTLQAYQTLLAELERAGIPRRLPNGIIYSKRMVDDARKAFENAVRQSRCKAKKKSGELERGEVCAEVGNAPVTLESHCSSSSTSYSKLKKKELLRNSKKERSISFFGLSQADQGHLRVTEGTKENALAEELGVTPARKKERSTSFPEAFCVTDRNRKLAEELGVTLREEFDHFRDYHLAKGSKFVNWDLAFSTWLRNAKKFSKHGKNREKSYIEQLRKAGEIAERMDTDAIFEIPGNLGIQVGKEHE